MTASLIFNTYVRVLFGERSPAHIVRSHIAVHQAPSLAKVVGVEQIPFTTSQGLVFTHRTLAPILTYQYEYNTNLGRVGGDR